MNSFYFKTFARVALLPYVGGSVIHIVRLIYNFPIDKIPFEVDWFVVTIGGYAGIGLIVYANRIPFCSLFDKIIYGLLIFHLNGSVILHAYILWAGSHEVLNVFSYEFSFFGVAYFMGLGYYGTRLKKRLYGKQLSSGQESLTPNLTVHPLRGFVKFLDRHHVSTRTLPGEFCCRFM